MRETEPGASGGVGRRQGQGAADGAGPAGHAEPVALGYERDGGASAGEASPRPIPTPWRVKWDRFSHGALPVIVFVIAAAVTVYLWRRHTGLSSVVGEVDARTVTVSSTAAGTLTDIGKNKISKYERVQQGEVIARLEVGSELQRRLALRQELERLHQSLAGTAAPTTGPSTNPAEASLRAAIAAGERELARLESTIQSSDIRAPITGRVTQVLLHPGQSVLPGQAIMEIVEEQGSHIITFLRQDMGLRPTPGTPVEIRPRAGKQRSIGSYVETVGARIEPVPEHQLTDPKRPEWGLPVRVALPSASGLKPGELVGLVFKPPK